MGDGAQRFLVRRQRLGGKLHPQAIVFEALQQFRRGVERRIGRADAQPRGDHLDQRFQHTFERTGTAIPQRGFEMLARGRERAASIIRRHRLAERLFTDTFSISSSEADSHACKFEHIISPELDQKICTFLGHPATCPHGSEIPPGPCCPPR